jgi:hypothetical protein
MKKLEILYGNSLKTKKGYLSNIGKLDHSATRIEAQIETQQLSSSCLLQTTILILQYT